MPGKDAESRSALSSLVPPLVHSRRGSVTSIAGPTQVDKAILSQTLDRIHNVASQTDALTAFDEYTTPPASFADVSEGKGIANEMQGGLSTLYSRLRASVGNAKESGEAQDENSEVTSIQTNASARSNPSSLKERDRESAQSPTPETTSDRKKTEAVLKPEAVTNPPRTPVDASWQDVKAHRPSLGSQISSAKSGKMLQRKIEPVASDNEASNKTAFDLDRSAPQVSNSKVAYNPSTLDQSVAKLDRDSTASPLKDHQVPSIEPSSRKTVPSDPGNPSSTAVNNDGSISNETASMLLSNDGTARGNIDHQVSSVASIVEGVRNPMSPRDKIDIEEVSPNPHKLDAGKNMALLSTKKESRGVTVKSLKSKAKPQHLEVPSRKSLAAPIISRDGVPIDRPVSRTSSTDSNAGSVISNRRSNKVSSPKLTLESGRGQITIAPHSAQRQAPQDQRPVNVVFQSKNRVLNKEYWMKDENANDCFNCGDPFTTFRRKHHCSAFLLLIKRVNTRLTC